MVLGFEEVSWRRVFFKGILKGSLMGVTVLVASFWSLELMVFG